MSFTEQSYFVSLPHEAAPEEMLPEFSVTRKGHRDDSPTLACLRSMAADLTVCRKGKRRTSPTLPIHCSQCQSSESHEGRKQSHPWMAPMSNLSLLDSLCELFQLDLQSTRSEELPIKQIICKIRPFTKLHLENNDNGWTQNTDAVLIFKNHLGWESKSICRHSASFCSIIFPWRLSMTVSRVSYSSVQEREENTC